MKRLIKYLLPLFVLGLLLLVGLWSIPGPRLWLEWQVAKVQATIKYALQPPEKSVFVPESGQSTAATESVLPTSIVETTYEPTLLPTATATVIPATPTAIPTPLPASVALQGVRYEDQHHKWSYCAPANLSMLLSYWGWQGNRDVTGPFLKPYDRDKNVMPYEMQDFIAEKTELKSVVRLNGSLPLLKSFLAAGFPVLVERGVYERDFNGVITWMGHYQVITGYDDQEGYVLAQDSYRTPDFKVDQDEFYQGWRAFNYVYLVAFSADREAEIMAILGQDADEAQNLNHSLQRADAEIASLEGMQLYFAYFNRGSVLVKQQDYFGAAEAYDQAFALYGELSEKDRPWRMMWYQTGPYFAYFYAGRYQDVINLADQTLAVMSEPILEETYYWRALAKWALGDLNGTVEDLRSSLEYHQDFSPTLQFAELNGIQL